MKRIIDLFLLFFILCCQLSAVSCQLFAQEADLELTLDVNAKTEPLPKIFQPNMDLSGRGIHSEPSWPQGLAAAEAINTWQNDIGFNGLYRLQYNLWEIHELAKDKDAQDKLLGNYEEVIKKISDAGGIVILDIFGTPAGLGKVLDKKSAPYDMKAFKELIKGYIRNLSCEKGYNIWYEVWSAPDLDDFFLGRLPEYLNMYRAIAEAIKELEQETKIFIPLGAPSVSWWFKNLQDNTIITAEKSLIYELIKFCSRYKLPLNFISWHAYSTDPKAEKEITRYNKSAVDLIRDWLSYFNFERNIPLIVDEWNYDREANVLSARYEKANIAASYIPARLKNMYEAGINEQVYFCLEDFQDNKEGIVRNVGAFWVEVKNSHSKNGPKAIYNVFRMLTNLGKEAFVLPKFNDEFVGVIASKTQGDFTILVYNYIDPEITRSYLSRNIAGLSDGERKILLNIIKSGRLEKILSRRLEVSRVRATHKVKALLKKAQELNDQAQTAKDKNRNLKLGIKNLKDTYLYKRYTVDSKCTINCEFTPTQEQELAPAELYQETLELSPYSVEMIILSKKPNPSSN